MQGMILSIATLCISQSHISKGCTNKKMHVEFNVVYREFEDIPCQNKN